MMLFLPDWDDRVDPGYDFATDRPTLDRDPTADLYAHEVFVDQRCYDGILVSRSALPKRGRKTQAISRDGLRSVLRLPPEYGLMGDCGAFGYINESTPSYTTTDVLDFYDAAGVDYGVSVDHIVSLAPPDQRSVRFDLTIANARDFLAQHRRRRHAFEPVGAVQGWSAETYADAATKLVAMGYTTLAIGGLVRSTNATILEITRCVAGAVGRQARLHLLGVARPSLVENLAELGVFSADSASALRTAWTSDENNYLLDDVGYAAVRVPHASPVAGSRGERGIRQIEGKDRRPFHDLLEIEQRTLRTLRAYAADAADLEEAISAVAEYEAQFQRRGRSEESRARLAARTETTLRDRPWMRCPCVVCKSLGIDVVIFRGANRNRRRGFHNLFHWYRAINSALPPTSLPSSSRGAKTHRVVAGTNRRGDNGNSLAAIDPG